MSIALSHNARFPAETWKNIREMTLELAADKFLEDRGFDKNGNRILDERGKRGNKYQGQIRSYRLHKSRARG